MRVLKVVPVEMEATQKVVGGLGEGPPRQKVGEKLGDPAGHRGRLFCLQKGDLLLVCTVKRGGSGVSCRKWVSLGLCPSLCGLSKA